MDVCQKEGQPNGRGDTRAVPEHLPILRPREGVARVWTCLTREDADPPVPGRERASQKQEAAHNEQVQTTSAEHRGGADSIGLTLPALGRGGVPALSRKNSLKRVLRNTSLMENIKETNIVSSPKSAWALSCTVSSQARL